ncbi:response regulator [Xanthobacter tagetidis]|uniref:response regulator n=1 Tax=Xanthobacter tagetidis TaxID=60216 RepID=UPI00180D7174|nr:response regulator [Xanthobacter tagetidis]MBB6307454.1 signal transduction histidine kinase/CheY-like chemotaxis protein [Xanthobacter tagetidis]
MILALSLVALTLCTLVVDMLKPIGAAVWVIYVLPVALAYLGRNRYLPIALAALASVLVIGGLIYAPPLGVDPVLALTNRTLGLGTAWIIAATGYYFISSKVKLERQEWFQSAQAGLAARMSGELTLDQLSDRVMTFLAEYLDAQVAALYLVQADVLSRGATYALPDAGAAPSNLKLGEGLIGQAARDRRSFFVREVPEGYISYGSSLGRARPSNLLIVPAEADGLLKAVLEFGFARQVGADELMLLERLAHSVAIAIRSARYRHRLQDLVEETQRQSEELQAQSDALRSANEELEEQSRSLSESQERLERQQAELEQTNAQLEEQTRQLEVQRDDLTRAQKELQAHARDLAQANRYKSEFVANMSHELRTPLNSLLILSRLLADNRDGNLSDEQIKYAQTIEASGNDLLTLINDILDISKIEAGHVDVHVAPVRVPSMMHKLASAFQAQAQQKGLVFRTQTAADAPGEIETDNVRLEQILRNFLSNAIKFTDAGEVVLNLVRRPHGFVAFSVRDTGIGIAPEQHGLIFEAFRQADGTIDRKYGGTGLGLSIARELARLLGGSVELDSTPGKGSTFTLVVPEKYDAERVEPRLGAMVEETSAPPAPPPRNDPPPRARGLWDDRDGLDAERRTILVVEDDEAFARILCDLIHEVHFQCLVAESADEGVELARKYLPDAVILDIGLPDHTGLSVLDRLKHDPKTRHIPVHVVSVSDYTNTALSLGAIGYMLKPVRRDELVGALEGMEKRLSQRLRRVLVVEDNDRQLESMKALLATREVEVEGAGTAAAALERLGAQTFDCVVLDLSLPDASGFDVLELLANDDAYSFPPVIVYTGRDLSQDEELRLRRYSKSVIIKGAKSPERLLDEVTLFLHQVVAELPREKQRMLALSLNRDSTLEGRRILIAEDDVRNVYALTSIFEPHGAHLEITRNGREALAALDRMESGEVPACDIILMDAMMPELDGLSATREIRTRQRWRNTPVIMLTAKAMVSDQQQCLAAGANDYLAKPFDVDKLLSLVRVWMPK